MDRLRFLASAVLLLATFLWTNCADAKPPQAPPVRKCFCEACQCGPSCTCSSGECRCPTCKDRLQAQPFGTTEESPLQIIRFTADWCSPCRQMHPAWSRVSAENPGLMSELDLDENGPLARQWGVTAIPCVVVVRGGKLLTRYRAGVLSEGQLRAIVGQWRGR